MNEGNPVSILRLCLITACLAIGSTAMAQFDGGYAPASWSETLAGDPPGGGSPVGVDWSGAPASVLITGGDEGCEALDSQPQPEALAADRASRGTLAPEDGCYIEVANVAPTGGSVSFDYDFDNFDEDDCCEIFGYTHNGNFTVLEEDGSAGGSGSVSFEVSTGDEFGFFINCTDCIAGESEVTISGFSAPQGEVRAVPALGLRGLAVLIALTVLLGLAVIRR